jgi:NADPH:quinone reductase-like Zn-dependent oxidoreductase
VGAAPYTPSSVDELIVKLRAIARNPITSTVQELGSFLEYYPAIVGCDVAAELMEVHPYLADVYSIGDPVIGVATTFGGKDCATCQSVS